MFFKKSKQEKQENKELLQRKNIIVKCDPLTKEDAIKKAGQLLADSGYVDQEYVAAMLEREKTFSTFMGNGLALPHGVEAAKKQVKASGISVVTFKEPIDWDGNPVQTVIGIAGVGDEHLEILSMVAEAMLDEEICENFASYDTDHIYHILTGKE
mgnify:FL=1|nr:PTS sugar transporter subunit IIA [uncultured Mediterraneibacter sp.]